MNKAAPNPHPTAAQGSWLLCSGASHQAGYFGQDTICVCRRMLHTDDGFGAPAALASEGMLPRKVSGVMRGGSGTCAVRCNYAVLA